MGEWRNMKRCHEIGQKKCQLFNNWTTLKVLKKLNDTPGVEYISSKD